MHLMVQDIDAILHDMLLGVIERESNRVTHESTRVRVFLSLLNCCSFLGILRKVPAGRGVGIVKFCLLAFVYNYVF